MTMITPSYLGETIEYSSLHACRSTLEDPKQTAAAIVVRRDVKVFSTSAAAERGRSVLAPTGHIDRSNRGAGWADVGLAPGPFPDGV